MIDGRAGGHDFIVGVCACGRRLVDLRGLDPDADINKEGIAHVGKVLRTEIIEINSLIERMDQRTEIVLGWK